LIAALRRRWQRFAATFSNHISFVPAHYQARPCQGRAWRRAFPVAGKQHIRRFLQLFTDAFGFPQSSVLRFRPDDPVMEVYRALYPRNGMDAMELEHWALSLQRHYALGAQAIWRDNLTLGELFAMTERQQ
jgi:hypothetical protein